LGALYFALLVEDAKLMMSGVACERLFELVKQRKQKEEAKDDFIKSKVSPEQVQQGPLLQILDE
jgi:hypothetical protein